MCIYYIFFFQKNPLYDDQRVKAFVCDISKQDLNQFVPPNSVDFATLIFVLSAISPECMQSVLENIAKVVYHL